MVNKNVFMIWEKKNLCKKSMVGYKALMQELKRAYYNLVDAAAIYDIMLSKKDTTWPTNTEK